MIITYIRSSSYGSHEICEHKYFLEYVLGIKQPSNRSAVQGTIVHAVMEGLAIKRLAQQTGNKTIQNEIFAHLSIEELEPEILIELAWEHYTKMETHISWEKKHHTEVKRLVRKALEYNGGQLDPRNQNVFAIETKFDYTFKEPWAKYDYVLNGKSLSGYLSIKGTVDLITELDRDTLEVTDYKTGARLNWATGKTYSFSDLMRNSQLLIYYIALRKKFPQYKHIIMTIFYIKSGGAFTLPYDDSHLKLAEKIIREKFERIKSVEIPHVRTGKHCGFCSFDKFNEELGMSQCNYFNNKVYEIGIQGVTEQYGSPKVLTTYGDGAGRKA